jgi:hypothetical protein
LPADNDTLEGFQKLLTASSETNALQFLFRQLMGAVWTATLVQVVSCTNLSTTAAVGFVDVQPMVHQVDGQGRPTPHGIIHNLPYFRYQGGMNAVIIDPQKGDIGIAVFASRDISGVKVKKAPTVPGSWRRNDPADGLYLGGFLNGVPNQYVLFKPAGIDVISVVEGAVITVQADVVNVVANDTATVQAANTATVTADEVDVISDNVNLGATGGKKVVLDGDPVIGGGGGTVQASSTKVKAV